MDPVLQQWRSADPSPLATRPPQDPASCPPFGWARMAPLFGLTAWSTPALVALFASARTHGATPLHAGNIRLLADVLADAEARSDQATFYTALHLLHAVPGDWTPDAALDDDMGVASTVHEVMSVFDRLLHGTRLSPPERRRLAEKHLALLRWATAYRRADIARFDREMLAYWSSEAYAPQPDGYRGAHARLQDALDGRSASVSAPPREYHQRRPISRGMPLPRETWEYTHAPRERYPETMPVDRDRGRDYGARYTLPPLPQVAGIPLAVDCDRGRDYGARYSLPPLPQVAGIPPPRPLSQFATTSASRRLSETRSSSENRLLASETALEVDGRPSSRSSRSFSYVPYDMRPPSVPRVSRELETEEGGERYEPGPLGHGVEYGNAAGHHYDLGHEPEHGLEYHEQYNEHDREPEHDEAPDAPHADANPSFVGEDNVEDNVDDNLEYTDAGDDEDDDDGVLCPCNKCLKEKALLEFRASSPITPVQVERDAATEGYMASGENSPGSREPSAEPQEAKEQEPQERGDPERTPTPEMCGNDDAPRYDASLATPPPGRYFDRASPATPSAISSLAVHATPPPLADVGVPRTRVSAPVSARGLGSPYTSPGPGGGLPGRAVPHDKFLSLRSMRGQSISPSLFPAARLADRRREAARASEPLLARRGAILPPLINVPPSPLQYRKVYPPSTRPNPYTAPRTPRRPPPPCTPPHPGSPSWHPPSHGPPAFSPSWQPPSHGAPSPPRFSPSARASPHASPSNTPGAVRQAAMDAVEAQAATQRVAEWRAGEAEFDEAGYSADAAYAASPHTPRRVPSERSERSPRPREAAHPYHRLRPGRRWKPRPSEYAPWSSVTDSEPGEPSGQYEPWSPAGQV